MSNLKTKSVGFVKSSTLIESDVCIEKKMRILGDYSWFSINCYTPEEQPYFLEYFTWFWVYSILSIVLLYTLVSYSNPRRYPYYESLDKKGGFAVTVAVYTIYVLFRVYWCPYQEHYWLFVPLATSAISLSAAAVMLGYFLISYFTDFFEGKITPLFLQIGVTKILTRLSCVIGFILFIYFLEISARYAVDNYSLVDSLPLKQGGGEESPEAANGVSSNPKGLRIVQVGVITVLIFCAVCAVCFGLL